MTGPVTAISMSGFKADDAFAVEAVGHYPAATFNSTGEDVSKCCHMTSPEG